MGPQLGVRSLLGAAPASRLWKRESWMLEPDRHQRGAPELEQPAGVAAVLLQAHALAGGRILAEVRDATIHPDSAATRTQVHIATDDGDEPGDLSDLVAQAG